MSFNKLLSLNVNNKTEKKKTGSQTLSYLSWSFAWSEFVKVYPDATYEIVKNNNGLPYFMDEIGAMCYTKVTANNLTHEMWLPVMDGANKPMTSESYEYSTKNGKKTCLALNMFDVNKTLMRCLVKNLAMFGLGLYIYAGEDLPEPPQPTQEELEAIKKENELKKQINDYKKEIGATLLKLTEYGVDEIAIKNSIQKNLGVDTLFKCNDLDKLKSFYLSKTNELKELIEKK